jgi:hypothetical protein
MSRDQSADVHRIMISVSCARLLAAWPLATALAAAACTTTPETAAPAHTPFTVSAEDLPPIPVCRDEMAAFVEVNQLARTHGNEWVIFAPAITAMKRQILECVADDEEQSSSRL